MDWFKNLFNMGGQPTIGQPTIVQPTIGQPGNVPVWADGSGAHPGIESGYQPVYGQYTTPKATMYDDFGDPTKYDVSIGMGGAPDIRSPFKKFADGIDKDFVAAALASLGSGRQGRLSGGRGGGGGGRGGIGSTVKPTEGLSPVLADIKPQAPNPGFYKLLPREQKDRYSEGF